jgi:hypothetical protein
MGVDWNQVRINNQGVLGPDDRARLTAQEAEWLKKRRAEQAEEDAQARLKADVKAFTAFAVGKSKAATKAGDTRGAEVWAQAVDNIADKGLWTVDKAIASDPEIVGFQGLRTQLLYQGKTSRVKG